MDLNVEQMQLGLFMIVLEVINLGGPPPPSSEVHQFNRVDSG